LRTVSANTSDVVPGAMSVPKSSTNPFDELAHEVDVVLDEQDRSLLATYGTQALGQLGGLARSSPDDGSSSSTSFGLICAVISTNRPMPRLSDSTFRSATGPRPSRSSIAWARLSAAVGRPRNSKSFHAPRSLCALGDKEVFARRHTGEELDALERASDAHPGPSVRRLACQVAPANVRPPFSFRTPSKQLKKVVSPRRSADQPDDLTFTDIDAHRRAR
jgi:hypothetical protein